MYYDIQQPPGVYGTGTARQARGRWLDSSLVRSPDGPDVQPIGGWVKRGASTVTGAARAIITWSDPTNSRWIGIGTHSHLYVQTASAALFDITPAGFTSGRADAVAQGGYGSGLYGVGSYGSPRPDTQTIFPASVWTLDPWGSHLVGCMADDGKLYEWALATGTPAAVITNAPTGQNGLLVSTDRFLFSYAGQTITWCDQGADTVWTPTATNQAGNVTLDTYGNFRFGRRVPGAHLHFTNVDVWASTYLGLPIVHGFQRVGSDCGPISMGSPVTIDTRCVWMGNGAFFIYNGFVQPLLCEVADRVFANFNAGQASKVTAWHNAPMGEVWWLYPSRASTEIDSYVFWNYRLNHWWVGSLARTCATGKGIFVYPIMVDPAGQVWEHEEGYSYAGSVNPYPFVTSGPIEWPGMLATGDKRVMVKGFVGDEKTLGDSQVTFFVRDFPNTTQTQAGPYTVSTDPTDLLFTGRQVEMKIEFTGADDARAGVFRLDLAPVSSR